MEPNTFSPELRAKIGRFVDTIVGGSEPEMHEELASHVEDKIRGYLSGAERLSEEDALLLARQHFGDPEVVRVLLQEARAGGAVEGGRGVLAQRVALAASASFIAAAASAVVSVAWPAGGQGLAERSVMSPVADYELVVMHLFSYLILQLVGPGLLWLVLRGHRQSSANARATRLARMHPLVSMLGFAMIVMAIAIVPLPRGQWITPTFVGPNRLFMFGNSLIYILALVLPAVTWVWWCDRKPYRLAPLLYSLCGWALTATVILEIRTGGWMLVDAYRSGPKAMNGLSGLLLTMATGQGIVLGIGAVVACIFAFVRRRRSGVPAMPSFHGGV